MISIITPVYNVEPYIEQCLNSIMHQEYSDWEWILVDDGSTDRSLEIIRRYESVDGRIHVLTQMNQGPAAARNLALDWVKGDYITFLDSDDWMEKEALSVIDNVIQMYKPDMVMWNFKRYINNGYKIGKYPMPQTGFHTFESTQQYAADFVFEYKKRCGQYFPSCWIRAFKAEVIQGMKLRFNPELKRTEDYMFLAEAHSYLKSMYVIPDSLTIYRANENSITHSYTKGYMDMIDKIYDELLGLHLNISQEELTCRADMMYIYRSFVAIEQEMNSEKNIREKMCGLMSILSKDKLKDCMKNIGKMGIGVFGKKYLLLTSRSSVLMYIYYSVKR